MAIHLDLPEQNYHGMQAISFHFLKDLEAWGPAGAIGRMRGTIGKKESDAFRVGRLAHLAVLEGDAAVAARTAMVPPTYLTDPPEMKAWNPRANFCKEWAAANPGKPTPAEYPAGPPQEERPWNWNAGPCKAWHDAQVADGRLVCDAAEMGMVLAMRRAAVAVAPAAALLRCGIPEMSVVQDEGGTPIKARLDWIATPGAKVEEWEAIVDLKTCESVADFQGEAYRYAYHRQMAWYRWIIEQETGRRLPVALLAVEKGSAHRCRVYDFPEEVLAAAHDSNMRTLDLALALWGRNDWPADLEAPRQTLAPPAWFTRGQAAEASADPY